MLKRDVDPLPAWPDCSRAVHAGDATPLQRFVFDYQPPGPTEGATFRASLASLLVTPEPKVAARIETPPAPVVTLATSLEWIRLPLYCSLSGDTTDAVHARRRKRQWLDGVQCKVGPDGNLWVNPAGVNDWVSGCGQTPTVPPVTRPRKVAAR